MSFKSLIRIASIGLPVLAGAMAVSTLAQAQGRIGGQTYEMAKCTSMNGCGLTAASIVGAEPVFVETELKTHVNLQYGSVETAASAFAVTLPRRASVLDKPLAVATGSAPKPSLFTQINQFNPVDADFATTDYNNTLRLFSLNGVAAGNDAFSFNFNRHWRFMADQMDDNAVALQAIAAGNKTEPEDLLWNLSHSDFSVKMGLVRRF